MSIQKFCLRRGAEGRYGNRAALCKAQLSVATQAAPRQRISSCISAHAVQPQLRLRPDIFHAVFPFCASEKSRDSCTAGLA